MTIITLSASYGAGGSYVGPEVARRLGLPFFDRAISSAVAEELDVSVEEAEAGAVRRSWLERMAFSLSPLADPGGGFVMTELADEQALRRATEDVIRKATRDGGVILGRGAAWALEGVPGVLRVRLYGHPELRIAQAARLEGIDEDTARQRRESVDRARADYVKRLYGSSVDEPGRYDLQVDSTKLPLDGVVEVVLAAARVVS